jgi:hypothetical protein
LDKKVAISFSGGKESCIIYHLLKMLQIPFDIYHYKPINKEIIELFNQYIDENKKLTLPQLNSSNNSRSNANTVVGLTEQNNLNSELQELEAKKNRPINQSRNSFEVISGGSRKKSIKSLS